MIGGKRRQPNGRVGGGEARVVEEKERRIATKPCRTERCASRQCAQGVRLEENGGRARR